MKENINQKTSKTIGQALLKGACVISLLGSGLAAQATSLDLTDPMGTFSGTINGAFFIRSDMQSTGTGVIDSFVRINPGGNKSPEEGYNASVRPVMDDVNTSPTFTHDILLKNIPIVTNPGSATGTYYEFLLDINNFNSSPLLSLDKVQIYTRSTALTDATSLASLMSGSTPRYNMDVGADGDSEVLLNYSINSGSGSGDMFLYVPTSAFAGASPDDFVYLYSMFGAKGGNYSANDGFEEWAIRLQGDLPPPPPGVPDAGSTLSLLGLSMLGLQSVARRLNK